VAGQCLRILRTTVVPFIGWSLFRKTFSFVCRSSLGLVVFLAPTTPARIARVSRLVFLNSRFRVYLGPHVGNFSRTLVKLCCARPLWRITFERIHGLNRMPG
jgi:hypothetical protein